MCLRRYSRKTCVSEDICEKPVSAKIFTKNVCLRRYSRKTCVCEDICEKRVSAKIFEEKGPIGRMFEKNCGKKFRDTVPLIRWERFYTQSWWTLLKMFINIYIWLIWINNFQHSRMWLHESDTMIWFQDCFHLHIRLKRKKKFHRVHGIWLSDDWQLRHVIFFVLSFWSLI